MTAASCNSGHCRRIGLADAARGLLLAVLTCLAAPPTAAYAQSEPGPTPVATTPATQPETDEPQPRRVLLITEGKRRRGKTEPGKAPFVLPKLEALRDDGSITLRHEASELTEPAMLGEVDTVVVANVESISLPLQKAIDAFVEAGGTLVLFVGPENELESFQDWAELPSSSLPARPTGWEELPRFAPIQLGSLRDDHPLVEHYYEEDFGALNVSAYMACEPIFGAQAALTLDNKAPLLLTRRWGEGWSVQFNSLLDSHLPFKELYIELLTACLQAAPPAASQPAPAATQPATTAPAEE